MLLSGSEIIARDLRNHLVQLTYFAHEENKASAWSPCVSVSEVGWKQVFRFPL